MFQPGQKVVCILDKSRWVYFTKRFFFFKKSNKPPLVPAKDEVVTIDSLHFDSADRCTYLMLREYAYTIDERPAQFNSCGFQPLISDAALQEELSSITVPSHAEN